MTVAALVTGNTVDREAVERDAHHRGASSREVLLEAGFPGARFLRC